MSLLFDVVFSVALMMLVSLGLLVILGLMNIINLSHTAFMAVAAYAELALVQAGLGFWLSFATAVCVAAALGGVLELIVVRRLYGRHIDDTILATWGMSLIIMQGLTLAFGRTTTSMALPIAGSVVAFGEQMSLYRLFVVASVAAVVCFLAIVVRATRVGLIVRMVMTNEILSRAVGINTRAVRRATFVAGAAFAGVAGALLAPMQGISPSFALGLLAPSFLIVLMSGRTLGGLFLACLIIGAVQALVSSWGSPVMANVLVVFAAVVVLRVKPEGLMWRHG